MEGSECWSPSVTLSLVRDRPCTRGLFVCLTSGLFQAFSLQCSGRRSMSYHFAALTAFVWNPLVCPMVADPLAPLSLVLVALSLP